jgi:hypothetical protein
MYGIMGNYVILREDFRIRGTEARGDAGGGA